MNNNNDFDKTGFYCFLFFVGLILYIYFGYVTPYSNKSSSSSSYKPSSYSSYKPSSTNNSSYKPSGSSYSSSHSSSHSNNYLDFDPSDYDDPSDFADDAEDYFGDWDTAYDYWENY